MVKGIVSAFILMEFCLVFSLTTTSIGGCYMATKFFATGMLVLLQVLHPVSSTCCLQKKSISNTGMVKRWQPLFFAEGQGKFTKAGG